VLELYGLTVVRAPDGRKAIGQLAAGDIDLVLMDVMMPQLDGHETMRKIRQMPQFAHLPVIAVTARAMQSDREKSLAAGASDHVTKPVDIEELLNRIEQWLSPDPESSPADLAHRRKNPIFQHRLPEQVKGRTGRAPGCHRLRSLGRSASSGNEQRGDGSRRGA
jgi:CheY-like chemotaxis protein